MLTRLRADHGPAARAPSRAGRPGPLFVLGAPRSGTSVLYRCLALHPESAWVSNYVRRAPWAPELAVLNRAAAWAPRQRARAWFGEAGENAYRYGERRGLLERAWPQPVEAEPVFARRGVVPGFDDDAADAGVPPAAPTAAALLVRDLERVRRAAGGRVLVSKRIDHNRRVDQLAALFPDARFVVVTRDGRAVARSLPRVDWWPAFHVWWYGGTPVDWLTDGGSHLELAARHWVREVTALAEAVDRLDQDAVHHLRYEDLVAAPRTTLCGVARFGGLDPDSPVWSRALDAVRFPDRNAVGPAPLPEPAVEVLLGPTLERLGYR